MAQFQRNQAVQVINEYGMVVDATIAEAGSMGRPLPFYPDSTLTKYGNGSAGRTAWGYRVRMPILDRDTLEPMTDRNGREIMGISWVETKWIEAA